MHMVSAIDLLNRVLTAVFDVVCRPFQTLAPIWALTAISLVTGVAMVWIFGRISNQGAIREIRDRIRGNLIGVRLYRHEVGVMLRLQGRILRDTASYMKHSVMPMFVLIVPVVFIMAQLNLRFAVRPLAVGEPALVKAYVRDAALLDRSVALDASAGVRVETPPVRISSTRELAWRIRAVEPGRHGVTVRVGDETVETVVVAGSGWGPVPQRRTGRGALDVLLYPGERPIAATLPVEAIEIGYPVLQMEAFSVPVDWLIGFFVLSLAFGYLLKGALGVEL